MHATHPLRGYTRLEYNCRSFLIFDSPAFMNTDPVNRPGWHQVVESDAFPSLTRQATMNGNTDSQKAPFGPGEGAKCSGWV